MDQSVESASEALWRLIKDIRFAMFTTRHPNGHLHSRPMTTQNTSIEANDSLWFFMSHKSSPVGDLITEPEVNVVYAHPGKDSYVSVSGRAAVVDDLRKKTELWTKLDEAWFPGGPADADLALVQVKISHAHYWDVEASKVRQIYEMTKAAVTGRPPTDLGREGEVRMSASHR